MNTSDQEPIPNPNPPQNPSENQPAGTPLSTPHPVYRDWHDQWRAERWARREARWQRHAGRPYGWIGGALLIMLGVVFLLQNMGIRFLTNLWALFFLIPAFWAYVAAWDNYQDKSRLSPGGASALTVGILLTILAMVFLLNLDVGLFWPVILILGGSALLAPALWPK